MKNAGLICQLSPFSSSFVYGLYSIEAKKKNKKTINRLCPGYYSKFRLTRVPPVFFTLE